MGEETVEIRVLGPVELVATHDTVAVTALKQRRLLAALVSRIGDACSTDFLIDVIWGGSPPASANKLLQVYISQLRKLVHPALIRRRQAGYALDLNGATVDAMRFESLLREGRAALTTGNPSLAASLFRRSLALWRGGAYGEFAYEEFARGEAQRLEEVRLAALEARFDAELALGRHADLVPELCALAAEHPLRERLQAQAMLALYRSGRQSEALETYQSLNTGLREKLGLEPSIELRDLHRRILQHHPELEIARATHAEHTLPASPNRLIGRERELKELDALIRSQDVHMLVLTGAGGSGKTRLALEAARNASSSFANGAAVVALAPLRDPARVLPAISEAIGIPQAGTDFESVAAALRPRELLLVLDNAEHLAEAGPIFVDLLAQAPRLTLLVTSRIVLHLSGEQVYPVEPLREETAVALFLERARQADPRFRPTPADAETIDQICATLDRLPLAIELAAARVRTLTPTELFRRLEPRLPLLTGGPRDLPARQQTLRATLAWSFELLQEEERRDLYRLSVFVGGWTLEAAEAVCDASLDRLSSLLDHNLVRGELSGGSLRYSLLETVREFAAEALDRSTDATTTKRRFAEYMLSVAESANLATDSEGEQLYDLVTAEQDNLRAVLAWSIHSGQVELGLELAVALENFWTTHDPREGARWFDSLLVKGIELPPRLRMHALRGYGGSLMFSDEERARTLQEEALALARELGDERATMSLLLPLADLALVRGDTREARRLADETIALNKRVGSPRREAQALALLAGVARDDGDLDGAAALLEQSLLLARETGFRWWEMMTLLDLASLERARSRLAEAETRALDALTIAGEIRDTIGTTAALANLARLARDRGHRERAGRLWGAVEASDAARPDIEWAVDRQRWEADVIAGGGHEFDEARERGHALSLDEAAAYALRSNP
jgi:predicted ATPase/DNA-binding SARP family transcriptional activator